MKKYNEAQADAAIDKAFQEEKCRPVTYLILGSYRGAVMEVIDDADSAEEASRLLAEYEMAFGAGWKLTIQRG